jgi:hypothetical protein
MTTSLNLMALSFRRVANTSEPKTALASKIFYTNLGQYSSSLSLPLCILSVRDKQTFLDTTKRMNLCAFKDIQNCVHLTELLPN